MVMDALTQELFGKAFDRNGALAAAGTVIAPVLAAQMRNAYFVLKPPRTTGREQFGREFAVRFLADCQRHSAQPEDALATATALTAESIAQSYKRFVKARMKGRVDYIVSGGGARNHTLMAMLARRLEPMGCELAASEEFGLPAEAKEAAAFALMAWQTWHRRAGNIPAATGAGRTAILGQVTYA
jgi:anhydro-N-acetylmuramic acid kinase